MRVLYANPIFLDYRIPFFKELVKLFNGEFYVLYSTNRYKDRFDELLERIPQESGVISKVCKHILKNQYFIEANCNREWCRHRSEFYCYIWCWSPYTFIQSTDNVKT